MHALYVNPANDDLLTALYLPASALLRPTQRHALRAAATSEILKTMRAGTAPGIDTEQIYHDADEAFGALATLLGEEDWFLGGDVPGVLDAEVFAYTHLLVGGQLAWTDGRLGEVLRRHEGLVRHAERLYERCWGS